MAQHARSGSIILSVLLALCVLFIFGYLLFIDSPNSRTEQSLDPPIELAEAELPFEEIAAPALLPDQQQINEKEASSFVEQLADNAQKEVIVLNEYQDQFVHPDSVIALPELEQRVTTLKKLLADDSLEDDTPITLQYTEETREVTTLERLSQSAADSNEPITTVTESGEQITAPLSALLQRDDLAPDEAASLEHLNETKKQFTAPITLVKKSGEEITATLPELLSRKDLSADTEITQIKRQTRTEEITAKELASVDIDPDQPLTVTITRGTREFSVREILGDEDIEENSLFYLHRVTEEDRKGLWGIILNGLVDKFRSGLKIDGLQNRDLISVTIPDGADQKLPTGFSSFLGKVLYQKVNTSYVYNFKTDSMGNNPDLIYPGQQLIMIHFSVKELRTVYLFFTEQRNESVETFAIGG